MKRIVLILVVFLSGFSMVSAQNNPFDKYMDMKGVDVVYISESMLSMAGKFDTDELGIGEIAGKIKSVIIMSTERGDLISQISKDVNSLLAKDVYERLMFMKEDDSRIGFYIKRTKDAKTASEVLMVTEEEDEISVIRLTGDMSIEDIKSIARDKM